MTTAKPLCGSRSTEPRLEREYTSCLGKEVAPPRLCESPPPRSWAPQVKMGSPVGGSETWRIPPKSSAGLNHCKGSSLDGWEAGSMRLCPRVNQEGSPGVLYSWNTVYYNLSLHLFHVPPPQLNFSLKLSLKDSNLFLLSYGGKEVWPSQQPL